jgi:para-nitrobenzyl esterase
MILKLISAVIGLYICGVTAQPTANTTNGPVVGMDLDGVSVFYGIPFAAPPVGDLRWKAPAPPVDWTVPKQAVTPYVCPQEIATIPTPTLIGSEQTCLGVDVWTTNLNHKSKLAPVFVWIHGGGFMNQAPDDTVVNSTLLAQRAASDGGGPVVFVSIKYRLGGLGFMASDLLAAEDSKHHSSGNYGLLDQLAGLRWVQENVHFFGGDKTRVTIAGESAGGYSVSALLASPLATGLFHGAIMQSAYSGMLFYPQAKAVAQTGALCEQKHCKLEPNKLACLRKLSADEAWKCNPQSFLDPPTETHPDSLLLGLTMPNVDGYVLPCDPLTALRDKSGKCGKVGGVPVMIGSQLREENMFSNCKSLLLRSTPLPALTTHFCCLLHPIVHVPFMITKTTRTFVDFLPPYSKVAGITSADQLSTEVLKQIPTEFSSLFTSQTRTTKTMTDAQIKQVGRSKHTN